MYSQGIVKGVVYDRDTKEPLPGANILVKGTNQGGSSDFDGKFTLKTTSNKGTLVVLYIGYENKEVPFVISNPQAKLEIFLNPDAQSLAEVVVTGNSLLDIAKERQTPVAVSSIKAAEISQKLGNMEFPEILNRTPSVYATKSGGGFGDSRINIRGFEQENIAVMVNGMPVNDMENGRVYWSNWAGISDVASVMQVQRGLGASKLAIASVGGTINIVTRSSQMNQGGVVSTSIANNDYVKSLVAYNTGKSQKGWSASMLVSRTAGATYADATDFEAYNYFLAVGYNPNEKHGFQFMVTGAPQWHDQRTTDLSIDEYLKRGENGKPNRRFNSDWGYWKGQKYNLRRNVYHKPVATFNWDWNISPKTSINSVLYASFGRGMGTGDTGGINKKKASAFRGENGLYDWTSLVEANQNSTAKNGYIVRRASVNSHDWYGILSNFNHKISDNWSLNLGFDGRYYYGYHYQVLVDLLGAAAFENKANKNLEKPVLVTNTTSLRPVAFPFFAKPEAVENKITYSNDGEVRWLGAFGQLEYTSEKVSAFVQGAISNQGFQRVDEFVKPGTLAITTDPNSKMNTKTGFKNINGYNIKTGINYNINQQHNVFANIGYYSKQPFFNAVYPNFRNYLNENLTNEKIFGIEAGYGFKSEWANINLNLYRTSWKDRFLRRNETIERKAADGKVEKIRGYSNILGITEVHQGIEFEADFRITDYLKAKASVSVGDWFYKGNAKGTLFNENNETIDAQGNVVDAADSAERILYLNNVKVGNSAQKAASLGVDITPLKGWNIDVDWRYISDLYARLNVEHFTTEAAAERGSLKLPAYNLFDLGVSYKTKVTDSSSLTFRVNINNLLDTYYIQEATTNRHAKTLADFKDTPNQTAQQQYEHYRANGLYQGIDKTNNVYFGFGRTWNVSVRYNF